MKKRKGIVGLWLGIFLITTFFIVLAVLFIPLLISFSSESYKIGRDILSEVNVSEYHPELQTALNQSVSGAEFQINILTNFFNYLWVFLILGIIFFIYIFIRRETEYRAGDVVT